MVFLQDRLTWSQVFSKTQHSTRRTCIGLEGAVNTTASSVPLKHEPRVERGGGVGEEAGELGPVGNFGETSLSHGCFVPVSLACDFFRLSASLQASLCTVLSVSVAGASQMRLRCVSHSSLSAEYHSVSRLG